MDNYVFFQSVTTITRILCEYLLYSSIYNLPKHVGSCGRAPQKIFWITLPCSYTPYSRWRPSVAKVVEVNTYPSWCPISERTRRAFCRCAETEDDTIFLEQASKIYKNKKIINMVGNVSSQINCRW